LAAVNPRSSAIILDLAREQQQALVQRANDLDTKAAALLGFTGLLLGLLFSSSLAVQHWNELFTAGAALLGVALLPLGATLYPARVRVNPNLDELIDGGCDPAPAALEAFIASSLQRSIRAGIRAVRIKSMFVRSGSVLIAVAVGLVAGRFLHVLDTAHAPIAAPAFPLLGLLYL
jgi:hypothetical protein